MFITDFHNCLNNTNGDAKFQCFTKNPFKQRLF